MRLFLFVGEHQLQTLVLEKIDLINFSQIDDAAQNFMERIVRNLLRF